MQSFSFKRVILSSEITQSNVVLDRFEFAIFNRSCSPRQITMSYIVVLDVRDGSLHIFCFYSIPDWSKWSYPSRFSEGTLYFLFIVVLNRRYPLSFWVFWRWTSLSHSRMNDHEWIFLHICRCPRCLHWLKQLYSFCCWVYFVRTFAIFRECLEYWSCCRIFVLFRIYLCRSCNICVVPDIFTPFPCSKMFWILASS